MNRINARFAEGEFPLGWLMVGPDRNDRLLVRMEKQCPSSSEGVKLPCLPILWWIPLFQVDFEPARKIVGLLPNSN